jgi:O-antigen/teichoic acid export membrane protein
VSADSNSNSSPLGAGKRLGWGLADQALSSLTNFAVGVMVARSVSARDFGVFSLIFATYLIALGVSRALSSEPLVVRYSGVDPASWRNATAAATATAGALGFAGGLACLLLGLWTRGEAGAGLLALGVTLPGLLVQDCWRFAFAAAGRLRAAFMNDLIWALAMLPALAALTGYGETRLSLLVFAWGGSATLAGIAGAFQAGIPAALGSVRRWLVEERRLSLPYLGEFMALSGSTQLSFYAIGAVAGLQAAGALRAGQILLGPLNVLFMGTSMFAIPEGVRQLNASSSHLLRLTRRLSFGLAGGALFWSAAVSFLPVAVGTAMLGPTWPAARAVVIPMGLIMMGSGIANGANLGLRSLGAAKHGLKARLCVTPLSVAGGVIGAALGAAPGAALGLAASSVVASVIWWRQFRAALGTYQPNTLVRDSGRTGLIGIR